MPKAKSKEYYSESYEKCIELIKKHKLSAERIAYRFRAVDIGRICAYLGIPNYGLNELEDAKVLIQALEYAPIEVKKPEAAKDEVARPPVKEDEVIEDEVVEEEEVEEKEEASKEKVQP